MSIYLELSGFPSLCQKFKLSLGFKCYFAPVEWNYSHRAYMQYTMNWKLVKTFQRSGCAAQQKTYVVNINNQSLTMKHKTRHKIQNTHPNPNSNPNSGFYWGATDYWLLIILFNGLLFSLLTLPFHKEVHQIQLSWKWVSLLVCFQCLMSPQCLDSLIHSDLCQ